MPIVKLDYTNTKISDTYVSQGSPTTNAGTAVALLFSTSEESLLRFGLGLIPNGAVINSATLNLVQSTNEIRAAKLKKVTGDWEERLVNFNTKPPYNTEVIAEIPPSVATPNKTHSVDITNTVQDWVNGDANYGIAITTETAGSAGSFYSNENTSSASYKPTLTIDYSIPTEDKKQVEYVAGNSGQVATIDTSKLEISLPAGIRQGDLIVSFLTCFTNEDIVIPQGWELLSKEIWSGSNKLSILYKWADGTESSYTLPFLVATSNQHVANHVFRNVKTVTDIGGSINVSSGNTITYKSLSGVPENSLLLLSVVLGTPTSVRPPLNFIEYSDSTINSRTLEIAGTYTHNKTNYSSAELTAGGANTPWGNKALVLVPITNEPPKIDGLDGYLGVYDSPLKKQYTVTDTEGDAVAITEKVNGVTLATKNAVGTHTLDLTSVWGSLSLGKHTVTVSASDDYDPTRSTVRTWTFLKTLPADAKTPEIVSGVGDLVPIFKKMKADLVANVGGKVTDSFEEIIEAMSAVKYADGNGKYTAPRDTNEYLTVNNLTFKPRIIIVFHIVDNPSTPSMYYNGELYPEKYATGRYDGGMTSSLKLSAYDYVNEKGFQLQIFSTGVGNGYRWIAID